MIDTKVSAANGTALSVSVMRPGGACSDVPRDVLPGSWVLQVKKIRHGIGRPERPTKATYKQQLRWNNNLKMP
jgi:hypothetical protein